MAIHFLSALAVIYSSLPYFFMLVLFLFIGGHAVHQFRRNETKTYLFWELNSQVIKVALDYEEHNIDSLENCIAIKELHLLFGILYLRLAREQKSDIRLLIFSDSVDQNNYRKLLVAARWAKLTN